MPSLYLEDKPNWVLQKYYTTWACFNSCKRHEKICRITLLVIFVHPRWALSRLNVDHIENLYDFEVIAFIKSTFALEVYMYIFFIILSLERIFLIKYIFNYLLPTDSIELVLGMLNILREVSDSKGHLAKELEREPYSRFVHGC